MSAQALGIIFSIFFHSLVAVTILLIDYLSASNAKPIALDFSISYDFVPKGNSLDKSLLAESQKKYKKEKVIASKRISQQKEFNKEKMFGTENGLEGADKIFIKENLNKIQARIQNKIIYPAIAQRMGWSGKVYITFLLSRDGKVFDVRVEKSSGYPILDKCAIRTVKSLADLPKPPMLTRIDVPFSFSLNTINQKDS